MAAAEDSGETEDRSVLKAKSTMSCQRLRREGLQESLPWVRYGDWRRRWKSCWGIWQGPACLRSSRGRELEYRQWAWRNLKTAAGADDDGDLEIESGDGGGD